MNTGVGDQVGLELVQVDVESTVEAQRRGDGADDLSDEAVEVLIAGTGDVQVATADVIDGLVVDEEGAVRVLDGAVGGQNSVVGLDDGGGDTGRRVDSELELRLLAVVGRETLQEEGTETRAGTTTEGVEDQEALEAGAVVCDIVSCIRRNPMTDDVPATRRTRSMTLSTSSLPMV